MEFSQGYTSIPETDPKQPRRAASFCAFASVVVILLSYGLILVFSLFVQNTQIDARTYADLLLIVNTVAINLIAMPCAWYLILRRIPKREAPEYGAGRAPLTFRGFAFYFPCAFALMYAGAFLGRLFGALLGGGLSDVVGSVIDPVDPPVTFVCAAIVGPVAEELFFRKAMIDRLSKHHPGDAILYSALLFAMIHGNLAQFLYAFPIGLLFGFVYYTAQDIRLTILLHVAINTIGGVVPQLIARLSEAADGGNAGAYAAITVYSLTLLALCVIGVVNLIRYRRQFRVQTQLPHCGRAFFGNAGFIVACVVFAGLFVLSEVRF